MNWGKRDLQSPALPLGHAAKTIQNIGLALSLRLIVSYNTQYLKLKTEKLCFIFLLKENKKKCGFSVTKEKIQDKWEPLTLTIDCEFINDSWIKIEN